MKRDEPQKRYTSEELKELYESGLTLRQLAELTGTSHQAVRKRLSRVGTTFRRVGVRQGQKLNRERSS